MNNSHSYNNFYAKQGDTWHVFATQLRREIFAAQELKKRSFHVYMPMILKTIRHARKTQTKRVPLFPGYGFIKFNKNINSLHSINTTYGVKYLITNNEQPTLVHPEVISIMKSMTNKNDIVTFTPLIKIGDNVRFATGPFANHIGTLLKMDKKGRVDVLLKLLCDNIPVKADIDSLNPI